MKSIIVVLLYMSISLNAQTEKTNQFDSEGRKHGKWVLYLDALGAKTGDSAKAEFYRYTWYDHGTHIHVMGNFINKGEKILKNGSPVDLRGPVHLLDGVYQCVEKNGRVKFIHEFKNGEYVSYKEFYDDGKLKTHFDYTAHADEQAQSWLMKVYKKDGSLKYHEMIKKDENGNWPKMKG